MQKLKKTRRKHKTNIKKQKTNRTTRRKTEKNRNTGFLAHEPPRKINISKGLAGRFLFSFFSFLCVFFFKVMFSLKFLCVFLFFCFYMCFFDCKCKSLKRLGENRKKTKRNRKQTEQLEGKHKQKQKYRISSPRTSAKNKYL